MDGAISKRETDFGISWSFLIYYGTLTKEKENQSTYLYFKTLSHMLAKYVIRITVTYNINSRQENLISNILVDSDWYFFGDTGGGQGGATSVLVASVLKKMRRRTSSSSSFQLVVPSSTSIERCQSFWIDFIGQMPRNQWCMRDWIPKLNTWWQT